MNRLSAACLSVLCIVALSFPASASAGMIDFAGFAHGQIMNTQYVAPFGVTVSALNEGGGPDLPIVFDSTFMGSTTDGDLLAPWDAGNLAPNSYRGNLLILAENDIDANNDSIIDDPDDEGSRNAGSLYFDFANEISEVSFDLFDIESVGAEPGSIKFYKNGGVVGTVTFNDLITNNGNGFYDGSITFGNNSANRIQAIQAGDFNVSGFERVEFVLGGSGAVSNVQFESAIPEPATIALMLMGIGGGVARARRRRS
ncbi:MAG: PEP-CTERM sorting domain-containing protein [Candidatus Eisenbacteria bacterium]|uniref:PEP-CTERM sorting domain-containing protein n=1 Tax=Eiseniibacteriota bacterium TaxID=2212470 RepID=A0A7Y2H1H7_UNCEI|nr:PEP-CTERM sorting domain-containing protein [Candidatus Eisenbacteria bacterium]